MTLEGGFSAGKPKMLFEGPWVRTPRSFPNYDVSSDGKRFLMLEGEDRDDPRRIVVVQNWFGELKRRKK